MKKLITLVLLLCMACSLAAADASPTTDEIADAFMQLVSSYGGRCNDFGAPADGARMLVMPFEGYDVVYVLRDSQHASVYVWNLISYEEAGLPQVLDAIDRLNRDYLYASFSTQRNRSRVDVQYDLIFGSGAPASVIASQSLEACLRIASIVDEALPVLSPLGVTVDADAGTEAAETPAEPAEWPGKDGKGGE